MIIDTVDAGVTLTPALTPGAITDLAFAKDLALNRVGEVTKWTITFTPITAIIQNGQVLIKFTEEALFEDGGSPIVIQNGASANQVHTLTKYADGSVDTIIVTSLCTGAAGCPAAASLTIIVTAGLNPGSVKPITTGFTVQTQTSTGSLIDQGTSVTNSGLTLATNTFTAVALTKPTGVIKVGNTEEYIFSITPKNTIPLNGELSITLSTSMSIAGTATCASTSTEGTHACTLTVISREIRIVASTAINSAITITVTNGIRNPRVEVNSGPMVVASWKVDGANKYGIDQDSTSLSVTPNEYGDLTAVKMERLDSPKIDIATQVRIQATSLNQIPPNSLFIFEISK